MAGKEPKQPAAARPDRAVPGAPANGLVLVGKFGGAQGVRGEIRVRSYTADPMTLADFGDLLDGSGKRTFHIVSARQLKDGMLVARVEGVSDRSQAGALTNIDLFVRRESMPAPEADEFYYADLIGLQARLQDGQVFGTVRLVDNYGAGDILIIDRPDGSEAMIAFAKLNVPHVDLMAGFVTVVPPVEIEAGQAPEAESDRTGTGKD